MVGKYNGFGFVVKRDVMNEGYVSVGGVCVVRVILGVDKGGE